MSFNIDDISVSESTQNTLFISENVVADNGTTFEGGYITESIIPATGYTGVNLGDENAHFNTLYLDNLQLKNNPTNKNILKNDSKEFLNNRFTLKFKDKFEKFFLNLKASDSVPEKASIQSLEKNVLTSPGLLAATESNPYTTTIGVKESYQASGDSIGVGYNSGIIQANNTVAIGTLTGGMNQGEHSIAIGVSAGVENQNSTAVAVGPAAGAISQGEGGIAVGTCAGENKQPMHSVLIGTEAGNIGKNNNGSTTVIVGAGFDSTILYNVIDDNKNEIWKKIPNTFNSCNAVNYYTIDAVNHYYFAGIGKDYVIASAVFDDTGFTNFKGISQDILIVGDCILTDNKNNVYIGGSKSTGANSSIIAYLSSEDTIVGIPGFNNILANCNTLANNNGDSSYIYVGGAPTSISPTASSVYYMKPQTTTGSEETFNIVNLNNNLLNECSHLYVNDKIILAGGAGFVDQNGNNVTLCYSYPPSSTNNIIYPWVDIPVLDPENGKNIFTHIYGFTLSPDFQEDNVLIIVGSGPFKQPQPQITYGKLIMQSNSITYNVEHVVSDIFGSNGTSVIYNTTNKRYEAVGNGSSNNQYAYSTDGINWKTDGPDKFSNGFGVSSIPATVGNNIAMGFRAGHNSQSISCIAIGFQAGQETQGQHAVSIGPSAGSMNQGNHSIAIGSSAGANNQPNHSVLIGTEAGNIGQSTINTAIVVGEGTNKILYNSFDHNNNETWIEIQNDFDKCNDASYCKETNSYYIIGKGEYNVCIVSPGITGYILNPIRQQPVGQEMVAMYLGYYQNDYGYFLTAFGEVGGGPYATTLSFLSISGTISPPYGSIKYLLKCCTLSGFSSSPLLIAGGIPTNENNSSMYILDSSFISHLHTVPSTNFNNTLLSRCNHILVSESSDPSEPKIVFAGGIGKDENGINTSLCYNKFSDIKNISPWIVIPVIDSTTKKNIFKEINGFAQNHIFNSSGRPHNFVIIGVDDNNEGVITSGRLNIGDTITYDVKNITKIFATGTSVIYNEFFERFEAVGSGNLKNPENYAYSIGGTEWTPSQIKNLHMGLGIAGMSRSAQLSTQPALNNIAVGYRAGYNSQSISCIAIGSQAGQETQGQHAVSIGPSAGSMNQGNHSVAIGSAAGSENQNSTAVAVGAGAGAVSQSEGGIAVGTSAGKNNQPVHSILIGTEAGNIGKIKNNSTVVVGKGIDNTTILYNTLNAENETWIELQNTFTTCNGVNYYTDNSIDYYYFAGTGPDYSIASATFDNTGFKNFKGISQNILETAYSVAFDDGYFRLVYIGGTKSGSADSSSVAYKNYNNSSEFAGVQGIKDELSTCYTLYHDSYYRDLYIGGTPTSTSTSQSSVYGLTATGPYDSYNLNNTLLKTCYHIYYNNRYLFAGGIGKSEDGLLCYYKKDGSISEWYNIPVLDSTKKNIFTTIYGFTVSPKFDIDNVLIIVGENVINNQGIITYGTLNITSNPVTYNVENVIIDVFTISGKSVIYNNNIEIYEAVGEGKNTFATSEDGKTWIGSSINPNFTTGFGVSSVPATIGNNIAMGYRAGFNSQAISCVAIGFQAGKETQGQHAVSIGPSAGSMNQGNHSIAIGSAAGSENQNSTAIAVGPAAGAISQGEGGIAVGTSAGKNNQPIHSVLIGTEAGQIGKSDNGTNTIIVGKGKDIDNVTILFNTVDSDKNEIWTEIPNTFTTCNAVVDHDSGYSGDIVEYYFAGTGPNYSIAHATFNSKGFTGFTGISQNIIETGYSILVDTGSVFVGGIKGNSENSSILAYIPEGIFEDIIGVQGFDGKLSSCHTLANNNFNGFITVGGQPTKEDFSSVYYARKMTGVGVFNIYSAENTLLTTCYNLFSNNEFILAGGIGKDTQLCCYCLPSDDYIGSTGPVTPEWISIPVQDPNNKNIFITIYSFCFSPTYNQEKSDEKVLIITGVSTDSNGIITYGKYNITTHKYKVINIIGDIFSFTGKSVIYNNTSKRYEAVGGFDTNTLVYSEDGMIWYSSNVKRFSVGLGVSSVPAISGNNISMGYRAGFNSQSFSCIALGLQAGQETQNSCAVAIGTNAGNNNQGPCAVAIGNMAGEFNQGDYAIAIGNQAGITRQNSNSIIINASTGPLNSVEPVAIYTPEQGGGGGLYIQPIRSTVYAYDDLLPKLYNLMYAPVEGQITYGNPLTYTTDDLQKQIDTQKILINDLLLRIEKLENK